MSENVTEPTEAAEASVVTEQGAPEPTVDEVASSAPAETAAGTETSAGVAEVASDPGEDAAGEATDGTEEGSALTEDSVVAEESVVAEAPVTAEVSAGKSGRRAQLEREGEVAADFLESILDICDLDGDIDVDIDGDRAAVAIVDSEEGRVPRRLVGQNGSVLEALQELTRLAVQSATGERSRLMLDVAGHRAERRSALVDIAKEAIEKVKGGSEREALTPMTAFERKVVHDEVLAAGLASESEGVEPRRFVVVLPA